MKIKFALALLAPFFFGFICPVSDVSAQSKQPPPKLDFAAIERDADRPATKETVIEGRVVAVTDGDSLTVLDDNKKQHKIRLEGIDAPEGEQAFFSESKNYLAALVFEKDVRVLITDHDRYGRTVGIVYFETINVNRMQLQTGMAWHYKQYAGKEPAKLRAAYETAERFAREHKAGIWSDAHPTPPWDFRKLNRANNNEPRHQANAQTDSATNDQPGGGVAGKIYQRGARGGCFYLAASGRKVYVERSLCGGDEKSPQ
jgi:endonuclease YncB( thermonuclease family)